MRGSQRFTGFGTESTHITFQLLVGYTTEELRKRHYVLLTVTQRWHGYLEITQTVEQILQETLFIHRYFHIFVCGGDDTDVETPVRFVTDRTITPFLYGTEQHLLGFQRKVAHLIKKQCAASVSYKYPFWALFAPVNAPLTYQNNADSARSLVRQPSPRTICIHIWICNPTNRVSYFPR